jgi:gliding motility-associated-like protein
MHHYLKIILFFQLNLLFNTLNFSQLIFEQEIVKGGLTGAGFSTGKGSGSGNFDIYIEPGSTIKKAYFFTYTQRYPPPISFILNGNNINFDTNNVVMNVDVNFPASTSISPAKLYYKEVTNQISPSITNYNITIPNQFGLAINEGYWTFFMVIIYENPTLDNCAYSIIINDKNLIGNENYTLNNLNPVNINYPTGLSLYTDRHGLPHISGSNVYVQGNLLGLVYGSDNVNDAWSFGGVKGHFYYQNNELFGLDDDVPNNTMSGSDGLADISPYLTNNTTALNFRLTHVNYPSQSPGATNLNLAYFLTYTTPCETFETTLLTSDTTTCPNTPVQLGASGGINYEWLPQQNLSCYDCADPVFEGDSTINYTVRIWSTDSCSKVLPVRVRVLPEPVIQSVVLTDNVCGETQGALAILSNQVALPHTWQINGGITQTNGNFTNLATGTYTIIVTDNNGCITDTTVVVEEEILVNAAFELEPPTGAAPLWVQSNNTTTNATHYLWEWNEGNSTETHPAFLLDTSGTYTVTLIAYNNFPECADTFRVQVLVYDSLQVVIPNVLTPNGDAVNDSFGLKTNVATTGSLVLLNRWGNVIVEKDFSTVPHVFEPLWDGMTPNMQKVTEGVYFYRFRIETDKETVEVSGFVTVI